ncbi:MAG: bifunctional UDP-N-acetylglucosamine diphosphorylase/glucosamine-1-phosphate N-acetyltransferase GlmU [Deltaproteobacteria bacterium]|nr:bifunctional UDP-N-acetylglucosamine diphosphorylase/glucosamine-1-phosphate N-acetyltransferase GlmU [Deltaproteobacteria bacterium]
MKRRAEFFAMVLAAGQGKRMKSERAKVLHALAGRPMLCYPVEAALNAGAKKVIVVVGHQHESVTAVISQRFDKRVATALQAKQLGTADAARCGAQAAPDFNGWFLILNGDAPLISADPLLALINAAPSAKGPLLMLVSSLEDASGYGRIIRDDRGQVIAIREDKDCTEDELSIDEFNPGVYAVRSDFLRSAIKELSNQNKQNEYYLTDLVARAAQAGGVTDIPWDPVELEGINDRFELAEREASLRLEIAYRHALNGVTIRDPISTFIDADVLIERDALIEANVSLRGRCSIGAGALIDVGCVLTNVAVGAGAQLLPYCVASDSEIGQAARVGPFSHLRTDSKLAPQVHVGNFVETKKTVIGRGSKANHLSYLGDGIIGERVNVGAGTIFCNYDGFNKHTTVLEDGCFIGSDSQIVAPLTVGRNSYVATGTTVTLNVPEDALAIGRVKQENKAGLAKRLRKQLAAKKKR